MAGITHAATPRPTTLSQSSSLTLAEALAILSHLSGRGLLCSSCGYGWAEVDNAAYSHCAGCRKPNATYNPRLGKGSDFERLLQRGLQRFVSAFLQAEQSSPANVADSKGKR